MMLGVVKGPWGTETFGAVDGVSKAVPSPGTADIPGLVTKMKNKEKEKIEDSQSKNILSASVSKFTHVPK